MFEIGCIQLENPINCHLSNWYLCLYRDGSFQWQQLNFFSIFPNVNIIRNNEVNKNFHYFRGNLRPQLQNFIYFALILFFLIIFNTSEYQDFVFLFMILQHIIRDNNLSLSACYFGCACFHAFYVNVHLI